MGNTYRGWATVIADGAGTPVEADLYAIQEKGRLSAWHGSLHAAAGGSRWAVRGRTLDLRLPNGRQGECVITKVFPETGRAEVTGNGPVPFGAEPGR
ncbi:hypothetical protein [Streptomyces sp. SPB162]|uniref:hypothetical protein n=1 Tax=Streptomyces sp. SPB162 TaxID=2940560 RepID=UPI0024053DD9|nr:hypothetical protein [Streptomyces sp. SPB162]MDF9812041.1 hypothetical protein [Streptomyces sp. SPB162]